MRSSSPEWEAIQAQATNPTIGPWSPTNPDWTPWIIQPQGTIPITLFLLPLLYWILAIRDVIAPSSKARPGWLWACCPVSMLVRGMRERWKLLGISNTAFSPRTKADGPGGPSSCFFLPLREQLHDTSKSVTSQSYCPLEMPDGKQPLPWNLYQTSSGYGREKFNTVPLSKEVSPGPTLGRSEPRICAGGQGGRGVPSSKREQHFQPLHKAEMT